MAEGHDMAAGGFGQSGQSGRRDRNRPAAMIDLEATEVASDRPQPSSGEAQPDYAADAPPVQPSAHRMAESAPRGKAAKWPLAAAAVAGAVLTLTGLALSGVLQGGAPPATPVPVAQQVAEPGAQPATADPHSLDDLASRVRRLETRPAAPASQAADPAAAGRLAALEARIKDLDGRLGDLARRSDEIAAMAGDARSRAEALAASQEAAGPPLPRAEVAALASRLAALERTALTRAPQPGRAATVADRALRVVVIASALSAAVDRGAPYGAELDAARAVGLEPQEVAALAPFAAAGIPGTDGLSRELAALMPAIAQAAGTAPRHGGGILERLKANAGKIVRVRRIDDVAGDDAAAVMQRLETRAARGDLGGAVAALAALPEPAQALAKDWIARFEGRAAAIAASRRFAAAAFAAFGKPAL